MILIIDYGAGNLHSVQKAFEYLGVPARITTDPADIAAVDKVLLPGVGAFGKGMEDLRQHAFVEAIGEHVDKGKQLFGICLGMQLLFTESQEIGVHKGLNLIPGAVKRFDNRAAKVPQIGWNSLNFHKDSAIFKGIDENTYFYFVHSFYCQPEDPSSLTASASYAQINFCAALEKDGVFAVQFHPEKSSAFGLKVLENFAKY
ncbi:MAG: imidazole glycerol phosphate synthase subunit HisH [Chlorobiales bacterium]|nr:imidazole glycerol phosphate synthase subunit HisH [Chlorobiales bacterium]